MRCAFVVGCPNSGTSWVWELLDAHPDTHSIMARDVWSPEILNGSDSMETAMFVERKPLERIVAHLLPYLPLPDDRVMEILTEHDPGPGKVLLEKTPWHMAYLSRIWRLLPDAKVILVRRRERDRAASSMLRWGGGLYSKIRAGKLLRSRLYPHRHDPRLLTVDYEDLHTDLRGQAERMCAHVGLDQDGVADMLAEERDTYKRTGVLDTHKGILTPNEIRWLETKGL